MREMRRDSSFSTHDHVSQIYPITTPNNGEGVVQCESTVQHTGASFAVLQHGVTLPNSTACGLVNAVYVWVCSVPGPHIPISP